MNLKQKIKKLLFTHQLPLTVGRTNEVARNEWLKLVLKEIPPGQRILDAGAGEKPFKKYCKHLDYVSQDFGEYDPEKGEPGLHVKNWNYGKIDIISDVAAIPVNSNSFDAVMCTEVLEHIVNPRDALKEFSRILKKNGLLILTAPFCSLTHFAPYHYYSGFSKYFYQKELISNNFEIMQLKENGNYFEYLAQEIQRLPHVSEKYSKGALGKKDLKNITKLQKLLQELSRNDSSSSDLLCFGFFVLAKKI